MPDEEEPLNTESDDTGSDHEIVNDWEVEDAGPNDLDEDVYSLAVSDLTRDFQLLACGKGDPATYTARFVTDFALLFGCMFVQVFLLYSIKNFVTGKSVHDIRIYYHDFEIGMYTSDPACYETTANGFQRGLAACFNASAFDDLDAVTQFQACRIPLSQPFFFGVILWIWTVVCGGQLYKAYRKFVGLIWMTKTVETMETPFKGKMQNNDGEKIIQQLTPTVKAVFTLVIILPKVCMTCYLLWLGCRWLIATNNFADLILNAMALEFILLLGEVLYMAMLPERNRHDLEKTKMMPTSRKYKVGCKQFLKVFMFNVICFTWVASYMIYFQAVLPDYRWDVHEVCDSWIKARYEV